jgi:hypothetical protein
MKSELGAHTVEQLIMIQQSTDPLKAELAKMELVRRQEWTKFKRSFFFPNLWAVLSLLLSAYLALQKSGLIS